MDQTAKLWDCRTGQVIATLRGHEDEVLDVAFDYTGMKLATASADGTLCHEIINLLLLLITSIKELIHFCTSQALFQVFKCYTKALVGRARRLL